MAEITQINSGARTINIVHPKSGDQIGVSVTIVSADDDQLARVKRKITDRRLYLDARGKSFKAEEIEENRNNLLFAAMNGWEWTIDSDGEPATFNGEAPDFNQKNVIAVFTKLPWFMDQVNEAVGDTKAFF